MVDALLLEWEDVLADTASGRREALLGALADEGVILDAAAYESRCRGLAVHDAARGALTLAGHRDETLADLVALRATRAFAERIGKGITLSPGAREFALAAQAVAPLAIVTTSTRGEVEFVLRLAGLDGAVSTIVSADDRADSPPSPAMFDLALEKLARRRATNRDRAIVLAPSMPMLRAGRAAGMRTIAVGTPAHVSIEADGAIDAVGGRTVAELEVLAGLSTAERPS
jgi:beta-phosphoglucomutase-like phosphatase (HAD superfamily)